MDVIYDSLKKMLKQRTKVKTEPMVDGYNNFIMLDKNGKMCRTFLQEQKSILFDALVLAEQLFPHLYEVQEIAEKRVEVIMAGLLEKNPAPDKEMDAMD